MAFDDDGRSLSPDERAKLRRVVDELGGERAASTTLRVSRQTIARALAVLPLARGTVVLLRQELSSIDFDGEAKG